MLTALSGFLLLVLMVCVGGCAHCLRLPSNEYNRELDGQSFVASRTWDVNDRESEVSTKFAHGEDDDGETVVPPHEHNSKLRQFLKNYTERRDEFLEIYKRELGSYEPFDESNALMVKGHGQDGGHNSKRHDGVVDFIYFKCPTKPTEGVGANQKAFLLFHCKDGKEVPIFENKKSGGWSEGDIEFMIEQGFNLSMPTMVYMGGWRQNSRSPWLNVVRQKYDHMLKEGGPQINLLFYDWSVYGSENYGRSAGHVHHLGRTLSRFFELLIDEHNYNASQIHLVSYSLSTHIAGQAGRSLNAGGRGLVRQITAIDPTGVCFHKTENALYNRQYGLRPTDAELVVARHYNMNQFGAGRPIGGVDVIVNNGHLQPRMMPNSLKILDIMGRFAVGGGSHIRATQHESAEFDPKSDCHEIAYSCRSYSAFLSGECADCGPRNESCLLINTFGNLLTDKEPNSVGYKPGTLMYITTGVSQFCTYHYQVVASLKRGTKNSTLEAFKAGKFRLKLNPNLEVAPRQESPDDRTKFTQLLQLDQKLNKDIMPHAEREDSEWLSYLMAIETLSINYMSHVSPRVRSYMSMVMSVDLDRESKPRLILQASKAKRDQRNKHKKS